MNMGHSMEEFEQALRDVGLIAKWEARGEARGVALGEARGEARILNLLKERGYNTAEIENALGKREK
jgi:hypothetical protein